MRCLVLAGLVTMVGSARADPRFAALAPGPSGDVTAYVDASVIVPTGGLHGHFELLDVGGEVVLLRVGAAADVRLFASLPLVSGDIGEDIEDGSGAQGHALGNPTLGLALAKRASWGDLRVGLAVSPLLATPGDFSLFAGSIAASHALAPWLSSDDPGPAMRVSTRLVFPVGDGYLALEPALELVGETNRVASAPQLAAAGGVRWRGVILFAEIAEGRYLNVASFGDDFWATSLAAAARIDRGGWALTPWIAAPLTGRPEDWRWLSIGCALDVAWSRPAPPEASP